MSPRTEHHTTIIATPFGAVAIDCDGTTITRIEFLPPDTPARNAQTPIATQAVSAISSYLADSSHPPRLPMRYVGTEFQRRVWAQITAIPSGQTRTYGDIASQLNTAARAVGQACGANPYPIVVPCHRVVGARQLGGFAHASGGFLLDAKRWLLAHERA